MRSFRSSVIQGNPDKERDVMRPWRAVNEVSKPKTLWNIPKLEGSMSFFVVDPGIFVKSFWMDDIRDISVFSVENVNCGV